MVNTIIPGKKFSRAEFIELHNIGELETYLRTLEQKERLKFWELPTSDWHFTPSINWDQEEFPLRKIPLRQATFSLSDSPDPTSQNEANTLYKAIYKMMEAAKIKAEEEEKPLRIVVGEYHISRSDLLVTNMITSIAKRLDIQTIGIEGGDKRVGIFPNFDDSLDKAAAHYAEHGNTSVIDERSEHSSMPQQIDQNQIFQMQAALEAGYTKENIFDADHIRNTGNFEQRHAESAHQLKKISLFKHENCLSVHGGMHLPGIMEELTGDDSAYSLFINTSQQPYGWAIAAPGYDNTKFADAKILDNTGNNAVALADSTDGKLIQIIAPGQVKTAEEAFRLSREAERNFVREQHRRGSGGAGQVR